MCDMFMISKVPILDYGVKVRLRWLPALQIGLHANYVGVRAICALSVEFHVQRLGYIRPRS